MRQAFVDHDRRLLICWSAKCGCTTLADWFYHGLLGLDEQTLNDGNVRHPRRWLLNNGFTVGKREIRQCLASGYEAHAISRDPMKRAVSGYIDKFVSRPAERILSYDRLECMARQFYRQAKGVSKSAAQEHYVGISFIEFLDYVAQVIETRNDPIAAFRHDPHARSRLMHHAAAIAGAGRKGKQRDAVLDLHWNTQVPLIWGKQEIEQLTIWDIEQFGEAIAALNKKFGCSYVPRRHNVNQLSGSLDPSAPAATSLELARRGELPIAGSFDSPEARSLAHRAYAIDYEMLGY